METIEIFNKSFSVHDILTRIPVRYGLFTAFALVIYFLVMRLLGWAQYTELRALNMVFMTAGIFLALRAFSPDGKRGSIPYVQAVRVSVLTSVVAVLSFAVFVWIYLQADHGLMQAINARAPFGVTLDPFMSAGAIVLEGLASSVIVSLIGAHYFKQR